MRNKKMLALTLAAFAAGCALSLYVAPIVLPEAAKLFSTEGAQAVWREHHTSLDGLAASADAIVVGEVVAMTPGRSIPEDPEIEFTDVTIKVNRAVVGEAGPEVTVEVPGDQIGHRRMVVADLPHFAVGERYLLFLKRQDTAPFLWYVLNNQAGFQVHPTGKGQALLEAADPEDEVASELHHLPLQAALARIAEARTTFERPRK